MNKVWELLLEIVYFFLLIILIRCDVNCKEKMLLVGFWYFKNVICIEDLMYGYWFW